MSDREKKMIESFALAIKKMDDFEKGRLLGLAEGMAEAREIAEKKQRATA